MEPGADSPADAHAPAALRQDRIESLVHERGFALVSTRSPEIQRLYFQCDPN
ncbi:MAG: P-hydroxybenzoate hydroxylase, partial [uncultured Gemmatimonadaceae bacterium]